ncbi:SAM hydrolase/SAM-dependent halogenase family protein [Thiorhodovibrio winogradskyi]|uniref:SAM hydrolase/SAM-dependent halogenase family protein n=1 Tax=Thiorhodovibrio winogradskyi TaxID=77007 RepID=UPI001F5C6C33|nr:SAM-dependent chlorinase/fluorinase [Thiorhodovibrio winogradskyi]
MSSQWAPPTVALDRGGEPRPERIALITDFGPGPYIGQLQLLAAALAPGLAMVNLLDDLPPFRPDLAAALIPALIRGMPARALYLCVVDPGVGGARAALALRRGQDWFVGPDNGLLAPLMGGDAPSGSADQEVYQKGERQPEAERQLWRIDWRSEHCSDSFHGRDLFMPIALALTRGQLPLPCQRIEPKQMLGYPAERETGRILYVDHYGNLITGLDADLAPDRARLRAANRVLSGARTFCEVGQGDAFWYRNAFGLVEIAANQRRADQLLGLSAGDPVAWADGA